MYKISPTWLSKYVANKESSNRYPNVEREKALKAALPEKATS